jgi:hypothetical protein
MSVKVIKCKPDCKCYYLHTQLENAKDPSKWEFGAEFFSTEFIQDALDMQLDLCKKIKNPFYC